VNYRGWKRLRQCLESLRSLAEVKFTFEVIIVDNQSNDNELNSFRSEFSNFIFIENTGNNGFANGCNVGANHSTGEFILFLNPDTIVNSKAINQLIETAELHPEIAVLSCQQINENGKTTKPFGLFPGMLTLTGLLRAVYRLTHKSFPAKILRNNLKALFPDWVSGSVLLISKSKFEEVGNWNEDYWMYFEDVDLCKRIRNLGKEIAILTDVNIEHNHGGSSRINIETKSLTKTETLISRHVYISNHFAGVLEFLMHFYLIFENILLSIVAFVFSLFTLFIFPKVQLYQKVYRGMLKYYLNALKNKIWLSVRSKKYRPNQIRPVSE
jgi:hypothetical protein